jgi:hypothetical protein
MEHNACRDELREERGLGLSSLELSRVDACSLVCINLWTAESVARFDPKWPEVRRWGGGGAGLPMGGAHLCCAVCRV